ncbi:MAG TPA: hypothetical protein VE440_00550 [Gaiellaceae bacterium]|nr:hypothetical protein [Gaiellaceae bacterium]
MKRLLVGVVAVMAMAVAAPAFAADGFTLSGTAQLQGNKVQLVSDFSDTSAANDFGAISFPVPSGATLATLTTLSAEFNVTDDNCGGGSPRFQITIGGKNVFVYFGPSPSFNTCPTDTWISTGNLVGTSDACRVDTSQLIPGTQCTTWAAAVAALGGQPITAIQLVVDGGWSQPDKEQTVLVSTVTINDQTFITPGKPAGKVNPAKLCKAERTRMGTAAFNELWGTNANDKNAFGKCVSTMAHAKNAGQTQQQIMAAIAACQAKGLSGAPLGSCVAAKDRVAATKTEAQEKAKKRKKKGK